MSAFKLRDLYSKLAEDKWRTQTPFSADIQKVHEVVFHPFRSDAQREEAYLLWLQRNQPCMFGRIVASKQRIHFCFLDEEDFTKSDQEIGEHIQRDRIAWKQRSLRPFPELSNPAHAFLLVALTPRIAFAAPDVALRQFSEELLKVWGLQQSDEPSGRMTWESLYLQHPKDLTYVRFQFSIGFFMAQGDGRWWHDHRIPGGLAFTANSTGHMRRFREWYEGLPGQEEWVLNTTMLTIDAAADTPYGKATWLRPLINGKPLVSGLQCPFSDISKLKAELQGKDWTRYGGHLHTDHAVRDEFFWSEPEKVADITKTEYLLDFTYLFDPRQQDFGRFIQGQYVSQNEVFDDIGNPEDYNKIVGKRPKPQSRSVDEVDSRAQEVERKLQSLRAWAMA
jgi:hypothetical protein